MTSDKFAQGRSAEDVFILPASFAQQRLWFIEQLFPGNTLYSIPLVFRLTGALQQSHLQQSIQSIVQRHESLRTTFELVDGQLAQVVVPELVISLKLVDLQAVPISRREAEALSQIHQEIQQPFQLSDGPLLRVQLWQLQDEEHLLLLTIHHIIFDEWSSGVFIREFGKQYTALVHGQSAVLPDLPIQSADFAHWQRQRLQGDVFNQQLRYWKQQLKDVAVLNLPGTASGAFKPSFGSGHQGESQLLELPQPLLDGLEDLSQQSGVTLFMTLLAAFQTLLHRYTGQTDIAIGSPIANRHRSELEEIIGFLVNSLVLRTDLVGDPPFQELLARVRDVTLAAYAHQDLPFEKLVEELQPVRSLSQNPLFQVVFALQNAPVEQLTLPGLILKPVKLETKTARFDLELYLWKAADNFRNLWGEGWRQRDGLRGVIVYNRNLFEASTIAALLHHFQTLLAGIVANPQAPLSALPLLTPEEQQTQFQQWCNNQFCHLPDQCIHHLFESQAQQRPQAIALQFQDRSFTYQQLNQGSNQLARYLQRLEVVPEMLVGICLEPGVEAIAAMLAILKAGGVYVPLDPSYPSERLQFMQRDTGMTVVITQANWVTALQSAQTKIICLAQAWPTIAQESDENLSIPCTAGQPAYVMYTSGSTGTPKGVIVPHRAVNRLVCATDYVQIQPDDRVAQVANLSFDAATFEIWGALLNGAQLIGIARETALSPSDFVAAIQGWRISTLFLTTALLNQTVSHIPDAFKALKYLLFGGEAANIDRVRSILHQGKPQHLIHVYGPTENTTFSTWYEIQTIPDTATIIPIGQAIANTQVYVLDANLHPVPAGAVGEIYLGGNGLAQGYLNRPELTTERFINLELKKESDSNSKLLRLYKTGDRALYRANGNLEFLGRTDRQVKIRGFRVELSEIEAAIAQHPAVQAVAVIMREVDGYDQLIAYWTPAASMQLSERELRSCLKPKLPDYMIPAAFVSLHRFPLTANGKLDHKALPSPGSTLEPTTAASSPTTSIEAALVELWTQLLGRTQVGIHDNFFELGGHSLLATQLISRIRDRFQVKMPLRQIFETPTIAELAQNLVASAPPPSPIPHPPTFPPLPLPHPSLPTPLSFAQQRLWFLHQLAPANPFYNVSAAIRLTGTLNQAALARSFQEIVQRHAALRTRFTSVEGQPVQMVEPQIKLEMPVVDLHGVGSSEREAVSHQLASAEAQRPFDLTTDPLIRVTLLRFDATEFVLLLTLHHIVADGWSLGILIRELGCCYTALVEGRSPVLAPLPMQYPDFARWQRQELQGKVLEQQLAYWRHQLRDLPELQLPSDRPRPTVQTYRGATHLLQISPALTQALEALSQRSGTSLFMTLLAAFQILLYRYTGQADLAIGAPIANRHRSEWEGLIGFFVNSLVLRADLSGNPSFRVLLERVRTTALAAYEHQDLPFEKLVEALDPDRHLSRNPLFQVAFALQNAPMQALELPNLRLEPAPLEFGSTRFDLEVHLWEPAHGLRSLWQSQAGISGFIAYSTDLFDRARIGRLIEHFQTLLQGIVANPDKQLSDLPLLTAAEQQQIFAEWSQTKTQPVSDRCFHQIVEAQMQLAPAAIAVVSEQESLTYAELNHRANCLAQFLQEQGVQPNALVGLCVERSADLVVGMLGILKAGGAYVPLDPNYPSDRLHFMLTDTQVSILLTQSWLVEKLPRSQATVFCLDQDYASSNFALNQSGNWDLTPDQPAYVIYTSGSTGTPKGVLLSHRGLCNVVAAQQQLLHPSRHSRVLQFSSLSFDASIFEIALALGSGGALYIPPKSAQLPGKALIQFLQNHAITHALLTPAVLTVLPAAKLPDLQFLITGGEACSSQVVDRWAVDRRFFNAYGPTETAIWATIAELSPGDNPQIIGRPVLNTQVYILDANLRPVPAGIPGELYIGGAGLAQGYLNRPDLTAERFIDMRLLILESGLEDNEHSNSGNPTSKNPNLPAMRLYRTGDRAQYAQDGTIEFLGRVDHQIKIRGFRVELGEIEATLQRHPAIHNAVVIAARESSETRLTAYFTLNYQYFQRSVLQSLQTQQIQHWQSLYNQTYQAADAPLATSDFNITGWNSSYTGAPISLADMQEWVNDRVQQILALKPQRVLEIGCGTGLLLFQIAPHCQRYVGTDFSIVSLQSIQAQLETRNLPQVELLHRIATDFEGIDIAAFDVVILNSIVQYFPSHDYLMQVLAGAMQTVASDGCLFIGDVRSLPLLKAFHTWVKFSQAEASLNCTQLRQQIERSHFEEPELAIDPAYFYQLRERFPAIHQVQIRLLRGRSQNEMTQFRYNVLLQISHTASESSLALNSHNLVRRYDWKIVPSTVAAIQQALIETEPERVLITNIPNRRVNAAVKIADWLSSQAASKTVGQLRENLQDALAPAIDPQDWWDLEAKLPYKIEITWSMPFHTGNYDVLLIRADSAASVNEFPSLDRSLERTDFPATNEPLQANFARQLIPELRQFLKQTLPDYMVPASFVPLEKLPLTSSGKLDRSALPPLTEEFIGSANATNSPVSTTELALIEIWQDLLQRKQVSPHDNFFELGGHSLLATQMTSRVYDVLGLELPLKTIFEAPTIAQIAPILDRLRDAVLTPTMPPLVRLDRSAYRRQRSTLLSGDALILPAQTPSQPRNQVVTPSAPASRSALIPLTLGSHHPPFFCVHPLFGVVFPYLELAHCLANHCASDRSFYGLQALGLDGKSPPLSRIEAIAAYYIQAIQTLQPTGPYFLGGWSFGGLVAFEMAQQLTQAGQAVSLLAVLDTPAPCHQVTLAQSLKFLLGTARSILPFLLDYAALAAQRWQFQSAWFARKQWSALSRLLPAEARSSLLNESAIQALLPIIYANSQAAYRYKPQPYRDRLTLFRAAEQPVAFKHEPALGWDTLATEIQLYQVPGNHLSLLTQPHVQTLAQQLGQCLSPDC
jgi:amino acid adenylation domain-containing protein